ncbi:endo-1,4-beta-xylanase [Tessaracoccus sp. OH4464_COT-324]|uniref:endo-1,4-beta-xylanase n=1 Tax=Tessaracoccus sp. OH4464_COT-324 TaxID=2491059 RepID=UPI000F642B0C|nr:endo-1,4-beta-xylanase [Tessaracoccus sp. OH4464_COT-324]RRD46939.1 1,4-beta-xylanase [Tessaracoccus sp. OH4464_COT-324]
MYQFKQDCPKADATLAHRRTASLVRLVDRFGAPVPNEKVTYRQTAHEFGFAATAFEFLPLVAGQLSGEELEATQRVCAHWFSTFNWATLPFYWGWYEPQQGRTDRERVKATARWLRSRGVRVKGHPLVWHTETAKWLDKLSVPEVERAQRERIRREVADFAGLIDMWDAINEVVIMPHFDKYPNGITRLCRELGRIETVRLAFDEARAANPNATLLINDFDLSFAYDALIEGLLAAEVRIDRIGLQTHMHQGYRGEEETLAVIERFARYGIPLHFTETTLVSGELMPSHIVDLNDWVVDSWPSTDEGEARQSAELERHIRTLFSHPAVEAFTYWNIWDRGAWLGAPAGLLRADGSAKPAMEMLHRLVKGEWWTEEQHAYTDADGVAELWGWKGQYVLEVRSEERTFTLGDEVMVALE